MDVSRAETRNRGSTDKEENINSREKEANRNREEMAVGEEEEKKEWIRFWLF